MPAADQGVALAGSGGWRRHIFISLSAAARALASIIDGVENTGSGLEAGLSPLAVRAAILLPIIVGTILPPRLPPFTAFADLNAKADTGTTITFITGFAELVQVVSTTPAISPTMGLRYATGQEQGYRRHFQIP